MATRAMDSPLLTGDSAKESNQQDMSGFHYFTASLLAQTRQGSSEMIGAQPLTSAQQQENINAAMKAPIYASTGDTMTGMRNQLSTPPHPTETAEALSNRFDQIFGKNLGQGYDQYNYDQQKAA